MNISNQTADGAAGVGRDRRALGPISTNQTQDPDSIPVQMDIDSAKENTTAAVGVKSQRRGADLPDAVIPTVPASWVLKAENVAKMREKEVLYRVFNPDATFVKHRRGN